MLNQNKQAATGGKNLMDLKPGSEPAKANLPHDFGADVNDSTERNYASHGVLNQDPGREQVRSNDERDGRRDAGVGVNATNAGAGSAGDIDVNESGLDGGTLAENIPDAAERDTGGSETDARFGRPLADRIEPLNAKDDVPRGAVASADRNVDADGRPYDEGADALNTADRGDPYFDATVGEISSGESAGPGDSSSSSARR